MSNLSNERYDAAEQKIRDHARVGLQFNPDRVSQSGKTVVQSLLEDGRYKNQFETHLSNGKLDPIVEGERAGWEDTLFGGAFSKHQANLSERPKYGALHLMLYPDGPCPRYGSCFVLLAPSASARCTFTYMDSHRNPPEKGTLQYFEPIFAALMTECFERSFSLGRHQVSPPDLIDHLISNLERPFIEHISSPMGRNLNHYIEAQIHGDIQLNEDAELLVADPSFRGESVGDQLEELCEKFGLDLHWHQGYRLPISEVPEDFRGPSMPSLAERITNTDFIDAFMIGQAAANLETNPNDWEDRGTYGEVLQELKCLWHVLVRFGVPAT